MDKLIPGVTEVVHELAGGISGGTDAAYAIMTTDTVPKQASLHHANKWNVGGMAKGAGMLAPALATMLCVVTTDAVATADQLDTALRAATHLSFDRLDVDGATSTNDTVLLLASGASGVTPTQDELNAAVLAVCDDLADQLMADAEGVTKRVEGDGSRRGVRVRCVDRRPDHRPRQPGQDSAFRFRSQLGSRSRRSGYRSHRARSRSNQCVLQRESRLHRRVGAPGAREVDLSGIDIELDIDLGIGNESVSIRTTDLSHAYVEENSAYSS